MHSRILLTTVPVSLLAGIAVAQTSFGRSIASCQDLGCLFSKDLSTAGSQCHLNGHTYTDVGLTSFSAAVSQQDLTWTLAQRYYAENDTPGPSSCTRNVQKDLYLGIPDNVDLSRFAGCALIFAGTNATFEGPTDTRSCSLALPEGCAAALVKQVSDALGNGIPSERVCEQLQSTVQARVVDECRSIADGERWQNLLVRSLRNDSSAALRGSSCRPVRSDDYELTYVAGFNTSTDGVCVNTDDIAVDLKDPQTSNPGLYQVVPIITSFQSITGGLPSVDSTCIRAIRDVRGSDGENAAVASFGRSSATCALLASVLALLFLVD